MQPRQISLALVIFISLLLLFLVLVPSAVINGYLGVTDTGMWCWIVNMNGTTARLRVGTEYTLMWTALAADILVYGYLVIRKLGHKYHWFRTTSSFDAITFSAALGMFWYAVGMSLVAVFFLRTGLIELITNS